jgi:hypothetical protein
VTVEGKPLPPAETFLHVIDQEAEATVRAAGRTLGPIIARETPRHSGRLEKGLKPKVTKTPTGRALSVGAAYGGKHGADRITLAQLVRILSRGTGMYRVGAGAHRPILPKPPHKALSIFGRKVASVRGQHPKHFMYDIERAGMGRVLAEYDRGSERAARAVERLVR